MSDTIKVGWLKDKDGNQFAPKTLASQVQTADGVLLEDKIKNDLNIIKDEIIGSIVSEADTELSSTSTNPVQNKVIDAEFETVRQATNELNLAISRKADIDHNHDDLYDVTGSADNALNAAKEYANIIANEASLVLQGLGEMIDGKADSEHNHIIADINGLQSTLNNLQSTLDGKVSSSTLSDNLSNYYTKEEIEGIVPVVLSNYYTKEEADNAMAQMAQIQIIKWENDD